MADTRRTLGQVTYEAYHLTYWQRYAQREVCFAVDGVLPWENLPSDEQEAWEEAGRAARAYTEITNG